jgi:hypothetical protein
MPSPNSLQLCSRLSAGHVQHSSPPEWETYDLTLENPGKDYKELELVAHRTITLSMIGLSCGFRFAHQLDLMASGCKYLHI